MEASATARSSSLPKRELGIVQRVRASLARGTRGIDQPHILIACSGGRDSVALASVLAGLVRSKTITATIAHVDHGQRADSADAAEGTRQIAETLGIPFRLIELTAEQIARHAGLGREEALRRERYLELSRVAREITADAIATAHHERDQAETVLLHLIRGAGLHGTTGMREWSTIDIPWWSDAVFPRAVTIWRPFLREAWEDVGLVARQSGLTIYEDPTNTSRRFRRNAIRYDVLPVLERISPGAASNIARFAELAGEDDDLLDHMASERVQVHPNGDLHRRAVVGQPVAIQRRVILQWLMGTDFDGDLSTNRIDAICALAERNRSGARLELGYGWVVSLNQGVFSLSLEDAGTIASTEREERGGVENT